MNKDDVQKIRDDVLRAVLPEVVFNGWNWPIIEVAGDDLGYSKAMISAVFPEKIKSVLDGFADLADREMISALGDVDPEALRVRDRVRVALMARYEWLNEHKEAERQALQYWVHPFRKMRAARIVWRTADRIWAWSGDQATDYNYYTKRSLLSGVIVSTSLAWLNDPSETMDNTASFLDRRIENVMQLGKALGRFKGRTSEKAQA